MPDNISEKITFTASSINQINHSMRPNMAREKSKTAPDHRKSSKPIMEKRRRARINNSLCQLKTLILDALKKDTSRHSKLEKADILEMTVKHLKNVQHAQMTATLCTHQPTLGKYRAGFSACITEVTRFMSTSEGASGQFGTQLLAHLASCVSQTNMITCAPQPAVSLASPQLSDVPFKNGAIITPPENGKLHSGFRVVQTSNGAFALLIPSAPGINVSVQHSSARPVAQCPSVSDSVWRPW